MASWSFYWRFIHPQVAEFARVCSYDRAGLGWSESGPQPRTPQQIATELHNLLVQAGEPGPYVLVGHSLGGVFVRQFVRQYRQEVVGMVLVDSAHENQTERIPGAREETLKMLNTFRMLPFLIRIGIGRLLFRVLLKSFPSVQTPEEQDIMRTVLLGSAYFQTTCAEAVPMLNAAEKNPPPLEDLPLIVIRAGLIPDDLPRGYSQEKWEQVRQAMDDIQEELAGLSANSQLVVAKSSVHAVQLEEPEIVIEAVRQIIAAASTDPPLREPAASASGSTGHAPEGAGGDFE